MPISRFGTRLFATCLALGAILTSGCEGASDARGDSASRTVSASGERALPRFEGLGVDGQVLSTDMFRRTRGVVFLFAEGDGSAEELAGVVVRAREASASTNIVFLGVSRDPDAERGSAFAKRHGLDFPILHDPNRAVSRKLGAEAGEAAVLVVDGEGYVVLAYAARPDVPIHTYDKATFEALRIESAADALNGSLGLRPVAPPFRVVGVDGGELALEELEDKVVVIAFFLHTCPHCHEMLRFLEREREKLDHDDLAIVPISVQDKPEAVRRMGSGLELGFPLYVDPDGSAQRAYAFGGPVPDTLVLNREHRLMLRQDGMEYRIEALVRMAIRKALGVETPILLTRKGYSGEEACVLCHTSQHETWSLTNHAYAFETLIEHGENRNPECLPCHVVGWDKPGGYNGDKPLQRLEGVQCENCHGRGGPHQSPQFLADGFEPVCEGCHNPEHSLRFSFAEHLPLVSHSANLQFADLSLADRRALLERRDKRDRQLFDEAPYVGSQACQSCHGAEYEIWSKSAHARSFATLTSQNHHQNADCQRCHTTGFERDGGFPTGGRSTEHVGCESCHGPGGNHVAADARKPGTILALTDKCDSCVILQICGDCHDDANDPGFEFEVLDKIERIRHGYRDRPAEGAAE